MTEDEITDAIYEYGEHGRLDHCRHDTFLEINIIARNASRYLQCQHCFITQPIPTTWRTNRKARYLIQPALSLSSRP